MKLYGFIHLTSGGEAMLYVGLDIHKSHITGCVLDGNATAHDLVRVMWAMLKDGTVWKEQVSPAASA